MIPETFRVAMCNSLRLGPYASPHLTGAPVDEWLIVQRTASDPTVLVISDTGTPKDGPAETAPDGLSPQLSIVALLAQDDGQTRRFLMVRHLPDGLNVPGTFFPADGFAELTGSAGAMRLRAFGRHAHRVDTVNGRPVLHDLPDPDPDEQNARNWHFDAEERPWPPNS